MGDKLKDMLYDLSDTLITLVIIVLIIGTVSWKISDSMTYSNALAKAQPPEISMEEEAENSPPAGESPTNSTEPEDPASEVQPSVNTLPAEGTSSNSSDAQPPAAGTPVAGGQKMTIEIKSGSTGYAIAKLLVEKGLVKDTQTFIQRVEALKLGSKLKAGTFEVTAGMPLDELIKVITGN